MRRLLRVLFQPVRSSWDVLNVVQLAGTVLFLFGVSLGAELWSLPKYLLAQLPLAGIVVFLVAALGLTFLAAYRLQSHIDAVEGTATASLIDDGLEIRVLQNLVSNRILVPGGPPPGQLVRTDVQVGVVLRNSGPYLLNYEVQDIQAEIGGSTVDDPANPRLVNRGGYIHANSNTIYRYETICGVDVRQEPIRGTFKYSIEYSTVPLGRKHHLHKMCKVEIWPSAQPPHWTTTILDESAD